MGILILNSHQGKSSIFINKLYRKLRDLEVNSLKRYVVLTSMQQNFFSSGIDIKTLLLFSEASLLSGRTHPTAIKFFKNDYELSWCILTYNKPIISLINGRTYDSGGSLSFLANRSAAYYHSAYSCRATSYGWFPDAGMSFVLSKLRGCLGLYLGLTGNVLSGVDLIWSGLCYHWMSPEAVHFMELTSEKQLEVSEHDAKILLEEHFLNFINADKDSYSLREWEATIFDIFNKPSLIDVIIELKEIANGKSDELKNNQKVTRWASDTLTKIEKNVPIASHVTFRLIRKLQEFRFRLLKYAEISPFEYNGMQRMCYKVPKTAKEESMKQFLDTLDEECLLYALKLETRIAHRMMMCPDLLVKLREYVSLRRDDRHLPKWTSRSAFLTVEESEINKFFNPLDDVNLEFNIVDRGEFPLSADPKMRRLNTDYDWDTGLDHDPNFMNNESRRWSDDYLSTEIQELERLLINYKTG